MALPPIEDVKGGDFAPKREKKGAFESKKSEAFSRTKSDEEAGEKKKKLNSDYAIEKKETIEKFELGYDLPAQENVEGIAKAVAETSVDVAVEAAQELAAVGSAVEATIEAVSSGAIEKASRSIETAAKLWEAVPEIASGDKEKPYIIPEGHRDDGAIDAAMDALNDADIEIAELQAAIAKLGQMHGMALDAMPEIYDGISDLNSQLAEVSQMRGEIAAAIAMAKQGYPHNIGALLMKAKGLGASAAAKADEVQEEAERGYRDMLLDDYDDLTHVQYNAQEVYRDQEKMRELLHQELGGHFTKKEIDTYADFYNKTGQAKQDEKDEKTFGRKFVQEVRRGSANAIQPKTDLIEESNKLTPEQQEVGTKEWKSVALRLDALQAKLNASDDEEDRKKAAELKSLREEFKQAKAAYSVPDSIYYPQLKKVQKMLDDVEHGKARAADVVTALSGMASKEVDRLRREFTDHQERFIAGMSKESIQYIHEHPHVLEKEAKLSDEEYDTLRKKIDADKAAGKEPTQEERIIVSLRRSRNIFKNVDSQLNAMSAVIGKDETLQKAFGALEPAKQLELKRRIDEQKEVFNNSDHGAAGKLDSLNAIAKLYHEAGLTTKAEYDKQVESLNNKYAASRFRDAVESGAIKSFDDMEKFRLTLDGGKLVQHVNSLGDQEFIARVKGFDLSEQLYAVEREADKKARDVAFVESSKVYERLGPVGPGFNRSADDGLASGNDFVKSDMALAREQSKRTYETTYDKAYVNAIREIAERQNDKNSDLSKQLVQVITASEKAGDLAAEKLDKTASEVADKVEQKVFAEELSKEIAKTNEALSDTKGGLDFARRMYKQMKPSNAVIEEAARKAKIAGNKAYEEATSSGEAKIHAAESKALKDSLTKGGAAPVVLADKSNSSTGYIGFATGNRVIVEAIAKVEAFRKGDISVDQLPQNINTQVIDIVKELKKPGGDSIQRMRFIEELRAELKQNPASEQDLEILAHSLKDVANLDDTIQRLDSLSSEAGVQAAHQSVQQERQQAVATGDSSGGATGNTSSDVASSGNKANSIVAELRNITRAEDLPRYAQGSTNATISAAVQAIVASSEYRRVDAEMVQQNSRAMVLDPSRSAVVNAAALNAVLNMPHVDTAKLQHAAAALGLNAEQVKHLQDIKLVAATTLAVTAQIQEQLQAQAARAAGTVNAAALQGLQPDQLAKQVTELMKRMDPEQVKVLGATLLQDGQQKVAQEKLQQLLSNAQKEPVAHMPAHAAIGTKAVATTEVQSPHIKPAEVKPAERSDSAKAAEAQKQGVDKEALKAGVQTTTQPVKGAIAAEKSSVDAAAKVSLDTTKQQQEVAARTGVQAGKGAEKGPIVATVDVAKSSVEAGKAAAIQHQIATQVEKSNVGKTPAVDTKAVIAEAQAQAQKVAIDKSTDKSVHQKQAVELNTEIARGGVSSKPASAEVSSGSGSTRSLANTAANKEPSKFLGDSISRSELSKKSEPEAEVGRTKPVWPSQHMGAGHTEEQRIAEQRRSKEEEQARREKEKTKVAETISETRQHQVAEARKTEGQKDKFSVGNTAFGDAAPVTGATSEKTTAQPRPVSRIGVAGNNVHQVPFEKTRGIPANDGHAAREEAAKGYATPVAFYAESPKRTDAPTAEQLPAKNAAEPSQPERAAEAATQEKPKLDKVAALDVKEGPDGPSSTPNVAGKGAGTSRA